MRFPAYPPILPTLPALLTALSLAAPGLVLAEDASLCTSLCTSSRQECRAKVPRAVELDREGLIGHEEKNRLAHAAGLGQPTTPEARMRDRSDYESRRVERNGMCDDTYNRCTRGCGARAASAGTSEVLTRQGRERAGGK